MALGEARDTWTRLEQDRVRACAKALVLEQPTLLPRLGRFRLAIGRLRAEMQALTGNDLVLPEIGDDLQRWASSVRESLDTPLE